MKPLAALAIALFSTLILIPLVWQFAMLLPAELSIGLGIVCLMVLFS